MRDGRKPLERVLFVLPFSTEAPVRGIERGCCRIDERAVVDRMAGGERYKHGCIVNADGRALGGERDRT